MMGDDDDFPLENVRRCNCGLVGSSSFEEIEETDPERCSELGGESVETEFAVESGRELSTDFRRGLPSSFKTEV